MVVSSNCRLLSDPPAEGSWNMAVDEALLESAAASRTATLRFYRWAQPTLSLGYFQHIADCRQHAESASCDIVRRSTGGGAIVHDKELTYSLTLPQTGANRRGSETLYLQVHEALILALAEMGVEAALVGERRQQPVGNTEFLCFERLTALDVVIGSNKIAGSAQRRSGHAVLQHGSVLLAQSNFAPQLSGIAELSGQQPSDTQLADAWVRYLAQKLECDFLPANHTSREDAQAAEIQASRYAAHAWTNRR